ncbi:MAG: carbon storage regulator [Janthinobacterium lividum]
MLEVEMLEFTRTLGETISLGGALSPYGAIEVQIVAIHGEQISLGISAPRNVTVHRQEIWAQIQEVGRRLEERAFD